MDATSSRMSSSRAVPQIDGSCQQCQRVAACIVPDRAGDVRARCLRGDDRVTALEEEPGGDGNGLARLGVTGDLDEDRLSGRDPLGLAQVSGLSVRQAQHHAALSLERPSGDAAVARAGGRAVGWPLDEQVVELTVDDEPGDLSAVDLAEDDSTAFHET